MSDNPLDGISLHGVPLEEKLKSLVDQECSRQFQETVLEKKRLMAPIHCKSKYRPTKEKNGMARELTQSEINSQYLDKNLMKCKTQKEFVICLLLSGALPVTNAGLFREFKEKYSISLHKIKRATSITAINTLMARLESTELSKYIEFGKQEKVRDDGKRMTVKTYRMRQQGLELKPKEAFELAKKRIAVEKKSWEKVREDDSFTKSPILNDIPPLSDNLKYNVPEYPGEEDITWEPITDTHIDKPPIVSREPRLTAMTFEGVKVHIHTHDKYDVVNWHITRSKTSDGFTISATFSGNFKSS